MRPFQYSFNFHCIATWSKDTRWQGTVPRANSFVTRFKRLFCSELVLGVAVTLFADLDFEDWRTQMKNYKISWFWCNFGWYKWAKFKTQKKTLSANHIVNFPPMAFPAVCCGAALTNLLFSPPSPPCQTVWSLANGVERLHRPSLTLWEVQWRLHEEIISFHEGLMVGWGEVMEVVDCRRLYRSLREPSVITDFRQIPEIPWYPDNAAALSDRL